MLLREFMYFDRNQRDPVEDNRYLSKNDKSVLTSSDLRKTRLTLKMIKEIRKAAETHETERKKDLDLIQKMYAAPPAAPGP
jgi:nucleosome binding factor SPN SPT16 subunit